MNYRFLLVQISWGDYRQTLSLKNIARVDSHKLKVTAETQTALSRLIELLLTNLNIVTLLLAHFSKPLASCSSLDNETDAWTMRHFLFIPACTVHDCKNRSVWWSGHPSLSESVHEFFWHFFSTYQFKPKTLSATTDTGCCNHVSWAPAFIKTYCNHEYAMSNKACEKGAWDKLSSCTLKIISRHY